MNFSADKRLSIAWIVVVAITLIYLVVDGASDDHDALAASTTASISAIGLALAKLRIIMREFMDVRHAPRTLRITTDALVITIGVLLLGTYLVGRTIG